MYTCARCISVDLEKKTSEDNCNSRLTFYSVMTSGVQKLNIYRDIESIHTYGFFHGSVDYPHCVLNDAR